MGATCGTPFPQPPSLTYLQQSSLHSLQLCHKHQLNSSYQTILSRIIQSNQTHILTALQLLTTKHEKVKMLQRLEFVNLELMDSLYYNLVVGRDKEEKREVKPWNKVKKIAGTIKQKCKQLGILSLQQSQVAILILAGGLSSNFPTPLKQLQPIPLLPSYKSLLQLQLQRCQSIAQLFSIQSLQIIIMLSALKHPIISFLANNKYQNLNITTVMQYELGVMSEQGKVVMDTNRTFAMFPNGTGDFLSAMEEKKVLERLKERRVEYLVVCSVNNLTESVVDPVMLGYVIKKKLDVVGKSMEGREGSQVLSKILQIDNKIYILDNRQLLSYPTPTLSLPIYSSSPTFTHSTIFRLDFLLSITKNQHWNYSFGRSYRAKSIQLQTFDPQLQIMNITKAYVFEKEITDMFWFTEKFEVVEVEGERYCPVVEREGKYGWEGAVNGMSDMCRKWLGLESGLGEGLEGGVCEISADISVWGENLEQIEKQLKEGEIKYPLYIYNF